MDFVEGLAFALEPMSSDSEVFNGINSSNSGSDNDRSISESDEDNDDNAQGEGGILFPLLEILLHGTPRERVQNFLLVARRKSNAEFCEDFRLRREVAYRLIDMLEESGYIPRHNSGKTKLSAELSFLMFLWFVGNDDAHRCLANLFNISISSVFRVIRRVVDWLITLRTAYIKWPDNSDIEQVSEGFQQVQGIHCCIGAIDGSHIPIIRPMEHGNNYFNRKKEYSIVLQAVVDSNRRFRNVYCGEPGSMHDCRVLRRSQLHYIAENDKERLFQNGTFIIGDGGYQGIGHAWLVQPFRDNGNLTDDQFAFNYKLSSTRVCVEQAFGILKGRFRRLLKKISLFDHPFIVDTVVSCCILHNICLNFGDVGEELYNNHWNDYDPNEAAHGGNVVPVGMTRRMALFNELFPQDA